jgi:hypothetical protein
VITSCASGDGCCPAGCNHTNDSDCSATCGNGTVEAGEICDGNCPSSCDDANACTVDTLTGSALTCSAQCTHQAISQCKNADGCCPAGCNNTNDSDCTGTTPIGGECSAPSTCASGTCFPQSTSGFVGGYCTNGCTNDTNCGTGAHCANKNAMTGVGVCVKNCATPGDCRAHYSCYDFDGDKVNECMAIADGAGAVGAPCTTYADCGGGTLGGCFPEAAGSYKGGYCTIGCDAGTPCPGGSVCATSLGLCFKACTGDMDCRGAGYACEDLNGNGNKMCTNAATGAGTVGDACGGIWDCNGGAYGLCVFYAGGYCSVACGAGQATCPAGSTCVTGAIDGYSVCMKDCATVATCRAGYQCSKPGTATTNECTQ